MSTNYTIIVTGGNTGLGLETAKVILGDRNSTVVLACRHARQGESAVEQLASSAGNTLLLPLDLASQASIKKFVDVFRDSRLPPLKGIVCNAGSQNVGTPNRTADGYETTFGVNHLGHYLLTRLLLDDMTTDGRITVVSSGTHDPNERTGMPEPRYSNAQAVANNMESSKTAGMRRYTTSKLCNVYFVYELARRLAASSDPRLSSIKANAIDPGLMPATGLARSWPAPLRWVSRHLLPLMRMVNDNVHRPEVSAKRVAELTVAPGAAPNGRYFSNGKEVRSSVASYDEDNIRELWVSSASMTGLPVEILPQSTS